jgi:hypothetical protein
MKKIEELRCESRTIEGNMMEKLQLQLSLTGHGGLARISADTVAQEAVFGPVV